MAADSVSLLLDEPLPSRYDSAQAPVLPDVTTGSTGSTMTIPVMAPDGMWWRYTVIRDRGDFEPIDFVVALALQAASLGAFGMRSEVSNARRSLSPRENAVAAHLVRGRTREAIARALGVSVRTVDKHLEHIYQKLDRHDRLSVVECFVGTADANDSFAARGTAEEWDPKPRRSRR
jgi:DNA-binding CsgD family transcriptional regulator